MRHKRLRPIRTSFMIVTAAMLGVSLTSAIGCFRVPVHATPKVEGAGGKGTIADPRTIQPGKSTRQEMLRDWGWCDAHVDLDRLFVCEVERSTSRGITFITYAPVEVSRNWHLQFLFVDFDDHGLVSRILFVPEDHLIQEMNHWLQLNPQPPLDLRKPIELRPGSVSLAKRHFGAQTTTVTVSSLLQQDGILLQLKEETAHKLQVRPEQLGQFCKPTVADHQCILVHEIPKPLAKYSSLDLDLTPAETMTFVRYLQQTRASSLVKE